MPLPRTPESKSTRETEAFRRGKHDRRNGYDKEDNPYVRSCLKHEPNLHEKWLAGWNVMNAKIENGSIEEYE